MIGKVFSFKYIQNDKPDSLNDRLFIILKGENKKTLFIFISLKVKLKNYSQHEYHFRYILFSAFFLLKKTFCRFKQKKIWNMFSRYTPYNSPAIIMHGISFFTQMIYSRSSIECCYKSFIYCRSTIEIKVA